MGEKRDKTGKFLEGNGAATRHGGEAAVKSIGAGLPLAGLAAKEERQVRAEMVMELAVRLHTAARLYWSAIQQVAGNAQTDPAALARLDRYVSRFGWLAGSALRAWAQVGVEDKAGEQQALDAAVTAAMGDGNDGNDNP